MSSNIYTDIRCPTGASSLMGKLVYEADNPPQDMQGLYLEYSCRECTKDLRRIRGDSILRVLHLYTLTGEFHSTKIQMRDGAEAIIDLETQLKLFKLSLAFKPSK